MTACAGVRFVAGFLGYMRSGCRVKKGGLATRLVEILTRDSAGGDYVNYYYCMVSKKFKGNYRDWIVARKFEDIYIYIHPRYTLNV